mgnify:CR=1 FL=1|jgi:hypothetical protein
MHINRFHWAISHYIGSQLRQCVLDPDGAALYPYEHPRRLPPAKARRLYPRKDGGEASANGRQGVGGAPVGPAIGAGNEMGHAVEVSAAS